MNRQLILLATALVAGVMATYAAPANNLEGTSWRLLNISSMDDTVVVPDDPNKYTLEFGTDGHAAIKADCNRGTGTWSSESPPQLTFGPIAATSALCAPPSISEKYLAQFK